jgi:PE family
MNHILSINAVESTKTLALCNSPQPILVRGQHIPAADEVWVAAQFAAYLGFYQAVSAQAAAARSMFANAVGASAASCAAIDAANAAASKGVV